jgi:hypothetical protein
MYNIFLIIHLCIHFSAFRTDTFYEDSMITKIYMFQFVNSYASFFYLAFIAEVVGDCPKNGCMGILGTNLAVILASRILMAGLREVVVPYILHKRKLDYEMKHSSGKLTRPEKELLFDEVCRSQSPLFVLCSLNSMPSMRKIVQICEFICP